MRLSQENAPAPFLHLLRKLWEFDHPMATGWHPEEVEILLHTFDESKLAPIAWPSEFPSLDQADLIEGCNGIRRLELRVPFERLDQLHALQDQLGGRSRNRGHRSTLVFELGVCRFRANATGCLFPRVTRRTGDVRRTQRDCSRTPSSNMPRRTMATRRRSLHLGTVPRSTSLPGTSCGRCRS